MTSLLESLAQLGISLEVLCGFPSGHRLATGRVPRRETYRGIHIRRCGWRLDLKRGLFIRACSYAAFLVHVGCILTFGRRRSLVVGITNPPFNAQVLWLASLVRSFRYQYIVHDLILEALLALGKLKPYSPITWIWHKFNQWAYRRADRLIVLGRDVPPLLQASYGIPPERCIVVPHWSPVDDVAAIPIQSTRCYHDWHLAGKFIVQYSGNMGLLHDMDTIVRAADLLRDEPRIQFLFIGDGRRRAAAEQLSRELKLTNITWRDFVPIADLRDSLACCHLALISLRSGMSGVAVPSKLYGILASGRGILAQVPADSEVALTVQEHACGRVIPPGDFQVLADTIRALASQPAETDALGERALVAYRAHYRQEFAVSKLRQLWLDKD